MDSLVIEPSKNTPAIDFNANSGEFSITGKSVSENTPKFYQPVFDWLELYSNNPAEQTSLTIQLDYFNTSSAKILLNLFKQIEKIQKSKLEINWFYKEEDEDMQEAGENYQSISKITFNIKSI